MLCSAFALAISDKDNDGRAHSTPWQVAAFIGHWELHAVNAWLWFIRRLTALISAAFLAHAVLFYTDIGKKTLLVRRA